AGGAPPYRWTIVAGDLPPGVGLDGTSGALAGTPVTAGLYPFTLQVADAQGSTARRDLSLLVLPAAGGH
ncbi:MAG TPA: Ig domain-containing protein, partial [Thermoanaerobaculia bacterium]|nr:Ig domain-containing protein [Thermoanaerobaculia bacterium]